MSGRRVALLIGNSNYDNPVAFPNLQQPQSDVHRIARVLSEYGDFQIVDQLLNAPHERLREAIEKFYKNANRGDLTLLYYSGHGIQDENANLYLSARNTNAELIRSTGVSETFLQGVLGVTRARHKVIILDCCFSGKFTIGSKSQPASAEARFEALTGKEAVVLASSGRIQQSFESDLLNSWFTQFIADGIETADADLNGDGVITVDELFSYAEVRVREHVPIQEPVLRVERQNSQLVIARGIDKSQQAIYLFHSDKEPDKFFANWLTIKLEQAGFPTWQYRAIQEDNLPAPRRLFGAYTSVFLFVQSIQAANDDSLSHQITQLMNQPSKKQKRMVRLLIEKDNSDNSQFSVPTIDFSLNWATGLNELTQQLQTMHEPKQLVSSEDIFKFWTLSREYPQGILLSETERYRSNWFPVELPPYIYLYKLSALQMNQIGKHNLNYPIIEIGDIIITFACQKCVAKLAAFEDYQQIETQQFISESKFYWESQDIILEFPNHKVIDLLNQGLHQLFQAEDWRPYQLSNSIAYYTPQRNEKSFVSLKRVGGSRTKLRGERKNYIWYYAVDGRAFLYPLPAYFLRGHIIFYKDGQLLKPKKQHRQRRSLGGTWYNKMWRDRLLGVMMRLLGGRDTKFIPIPVCCNQTIKMFAYPLEFESPAGYLEPSE